MSGLARTGHCLASASGEPDIKWGLLIQGLGFNPIAENAAIHRSVLTSFNDVVGAYHDRRRDGEVQGLGCLEIDDKLEPGRLFDWDVSRLCTFED